MIESGGLEADEDLARAGLWVGQLVIFEHLWTAMPVEMDRSQSVNLPKGSNRAAHRFLHSTPLASTPDSERCGQT
jgi:hypothetical protein